MTRSLSEILAICDEYEANKFTMAPYETMAREELPRLAKVLQEISSLMTAPYTSQTIRDLIAVRLREAGLQP